MRTVLSLGVAAWLTGCRCNPPIGTPPDDEDEATAATGTTGDTAPPPCDVPEIEPNDGFDETTPLVLERYACGVIQSEAPDGVDLDSWSFTLAEDHWLEIDVAAADGSVADVTLLLQPKGLPWSVAREDDHDSTDARVVFDALAGDYVLTVSEQTFRSGDRYRYDLLVSETKQPYDLYTAEEVEPNDGTAMATPLVGGDVVFGYIDSGVAPLPDQDWYRIVVPEGKHTVSIDVDAYELGSQADLTARFYDGSGDVLAPPGAVTGGVGAAPDPIGAYESPGNETVYIQLIDADNREGPGSWYVMTIELVE